MANHFLLCSLREDDRKLGIAEPGTWKRVDDPIAFLSNLSNDIKVDVTDGDTSDVSFAQILPTVWSQPLLYAQAFRDPKHPAYPGLIRQWRGLLGLIALRFWLRLPVRVGSVLRTPLALDLGEGDPATDVFRGILATQHPSPAEDWRQIVPILCDDVVVGALSPWTLVYTPASYEAPSNIPWRMGEGQLSDPADCYRQKDKLAPELQVLRRWLDLTIRRIETDKEFLSGQRDERGYLLRELNTWMAEIFQEREVKVPVNQLSEPLLPSHPAGKVLCPVDAGEGGGTDSDLLLVGLRLISEPSGAENAPLVEPKLIALPRTQGAASERVYGSIYSNEIDFERLKASGDQIPLRGKLEGLPVRYVVPEDAFFPPKLLRISESGEHGANSLTVPLTPLFFKYYPFTSLSEFTEASKRVQYEIEEANHTVTVILRLPRHGGKHLEVRKIYRSADVLTADDHGLPSLAVWPDFVAEQWTVNYAIQTGHPQSSIRVEALASNGETYEQGWHEISPLRNQHVWKCDKQFIGFATAYHPREGLVTTPTGLVLRPRSTAPMPPLDATRVWSIAFDFGTSNTHVMYDDGIAERPRALIFRNRTVTLLSGKADFESYTSTAVYAPLDMISPVNTYVVERGSTEAIARGSRGRLNDWRAGYDAQLLATVQAGTESDLKWAMHPVLTRNFIRHVVVHAACEAWATSVSKVRFSWSFPLSLPKAQLHQLRSFWNALSEDEDISRVLKIEGVNAMSESEAVGRALARDSILPVRSDTLSVAIDVGGGSTDIAMWAGRRIRDLSSIHIGANLLIPELIDKIQTREAKKDFMGQLVLKSRLPSVWNSPAMVDDGRREVYTNGILLAGMTGGRGRPSASALARSLATDLGALDLHWDCAREAGYLMYGGIAFYAGLLARPHVNSSPKVSVYFGGLGSGALSWLSIDPSDVAEFLRFAFMEGLAKDADGKESNDVTFAGPAVATSRSIPLKDEVARGLLAPSLQPRDAVAPIRSSGGADERDTIVGEVGCKRRRDGTPLAWNDRIRAAELDDIKLPEDAESSYAAHLLHVVLPKFGKRFSVNLDTLRRVELDTAFVEDKLREGAEFEDRVLQSVFAVELRSMILSYYNLAV